jgi:hypothetical protein
MFTEPFVLDLLALGAAARASRHPAGAQVTVRPSQGLRQRHEGGSQNHRRKDREREHQRYQRPGEAPRAQRV